MRIMPVSSSTGRVLALFGDVATELLIRLDGDEGLFRAYEEVEFLAPVYAGDYLEVRGVVTAVGTTSRRMEFEARKVIANLRDKNMSASAAGVVEPAVVVCRALGTCVVPKPLQRLTHRCGGEIAPEVILTAALVGAEVTREQTPHLPITAQEIAGEAARCREAGVAVVHLHVRNPTARRARPPRSSRGHRSYSHEDRRHRADVGAAR
jgi:3-keto-5-aminohexanoate cleavage enzyme